MDLFFFAGLMIIITVAWVIPESEAVVELNWVPFLLAEAQVIKLKY